MSDDPEMVRLIGHIGIGGMLLVPVFLAAYYGIWWLAGLFAIVAYVGGVMVEKGSEG